jgi:GTP-binding protein
MAKPIVAIVGRPNVGKSTLFNRLVGSRKAIVEDIPGVTRDRIYDLSEWSGREFIIIYTGGIRFGKDDNIFTREVKMQAELAIDEADVIILVVDSKDGITHEDQQVAELLRRADKPVIVAANKVENFAKQLEYFEFYSLGLGEPIPISAMHGLNTNELLDAVIARFKPAGEYEEDEDAIKIAIVGRPNVGKSSLVNSFLGEQRVIVSEVPGTTRDSIDTPFRYDGKEYILIDTAGIRRKSRISESTERYSVIRSLKAIERSDVVLIMLDAHDRRAIRVFITEAGLEMAEKIDIIISDLNTLLFDLLGEGNQKEFIHGLINIVNGIEE